MGKSKKKLLSGGIAGGITVMAVLALVLGNKAQSVETAAAVRENVTDQYTEEGRITFGKEYRIIAQTSGPVKEILVEENSQVEKGEILFTIDTTSYEYEKSLTQSTLTGLEAQLERSRINQVMTASPQEYLSSVKQEMDAREADYRSAQTLYEGGKTLYASGAVSRVEQEKSEAAYKAALLAWQQARGRYEESSRLLESLSEEGIDKDTINSRFYNSESNQLSAQIDARKTQLSQLEEQIGKCQVKAECNGIITSLPVNGMSVIQSGETAVVLGSREGVQAETDVLTNIAPYIKVGSPVEAVLQLRGKDETFPGTVRQIYNYASKRTSSLGLEEYRVHVNVSLDEETALEGLDGYGINLKFLLYSKEDCLTIPSSAVFKTDGQYYIYKIKEGRAAKAPIEVEYQTGTRTVVTDGLDEGDQVIGQADLEGVYEGAKVKAR